MRLLALEYVWNGFGFFVCVTSYKLVDKATNNDAIKKAPKFRGVGLCGEKNTKMLCFLCRMVDKNQYFVYCRAEEG